MNTILNILLGVVSIGFLFFVWAGGQSWGPEGPVGAWIVPVPFVFTLLAVMIACIRRGRFDWIPGGQFTASVMLAGFMVAVGAALLYGFERRGTAADFLAAALPFVILIGCFAAVNGSKALASAVLCLTSLGGWGLMGHGLVMHLRGQIEAADRQAVKDRAENEVRAARSAAEFAALPADAPLIRFIQFEFSGNEAVQKQARERIAQWPDLDDQLIAILESDLSITGLSWTISYIADIHPSPPARLAPAYAKVLDKAYRYWESTMRYDEYAAKSDPEVSMLIRGAERIQQAGGDLRPQLKAWYELVKSARGPGRLAAYIKGLC